MAKQPKDVRNKIFKKMPDFADIAEGMSIEELENRVNTLTKQSEAVDVAKEENTALKMAKDEVKTLSGPYSDAKKDIRLKIQFVIQLIGEKGGNTEHSE